ncbi:MAG: hypothetical protein ACO3EI_04630, partial [Candidatus Limnocylindrus sp.]
MAAFFRKASAGPRAKSGLSRAVLLTAALLLKPFGSEASELPPAALPTGGKVAAGDVRLQSVGASMSVTQLSERAV